ncbi:MAG: FtsX-like permease family protein [Bacteroidetes bacterium]|nr:FtsX-like permease family protein [Bacteroidota bacterium]
MRALERKLIRDLWYMRGMAIAIAVVIMCGVATFVMSRSTLDALTNTLRQFYSENHFAEVFSSAKRVPESVAGRIQALPDVDVVETRVVAAASLDIEGFDEPVTGKLISLPDEGDPRLNQLYIVNGRKVAPYSDDEVVVSDAFAEAHNFKPGDRIAAVVNGRRKQLTIVGMARSPEYLYQGSPDSIIPDFRRFGIVWMDRTPLASAFNMEGAFNDVSLTIVPGGSIHDVIDEVDHILEPYGGPGAYERKDQVSHFYISEEIRSLGTMATMFPVIFLAVAAFLLNVVVNRLVQTQREQIAVLKAFGYSNVQVGLHYLLLILAIVLIGVAGGLVLGIRFGQGLAGIYAEFYRFPYLEYSLPATVVLSALGVSIAAAFAGAISAVRRAASLPPAEAMRPEPPPRYRQSLVERMGLQRYLSQPTRMIIRHLGRHPIKAGFAVLGISFACGLLLMGRFFTSASDYLLDIQFNLTQRDDLTVTFVEPTSRRGLYSLESLPDVEFGEPFRAVSVKLRNENVTYRTSVQGIKPDGDLFQLLNTKLNVVEVPPEGLLLPPFLGKRLRVAPGDTLDVQVMEGRRPEYRVPVAGFIEQYIGVGTYMDIDALNRILKEGPTISGAYLAADNTVLDTVYSELKEMPRVAGVSSRLRAIQDFYDNMGANMLVFAFFYTLFAGAIAFAIVYNSARISLSERARELASLRILGFTQGEVAYILLGELALLTLIAIPIGFGIGWGLCLMVAESVQSDIIRYPFVLTRDTYAFAATIVIVSAILTGLIVRRRLFRLDLISVLKTRE